MPDSADGFLRSRMRKLTGLTFRSQLLIFASFMIIFVGGATYSFWVRARSDSRLIATLDRNTIVLQDLPALQLAARRLELWTDRYLQTGDPRWLANRRATIDESRRLMMSIEEALADDHRQTAFRALEDKLDAHIGLQDELIHSREQGGLAGAQLQTLRERSDSMADVIDSVSAVREVSVRELAARREAAERTTSRVNALILLTGLLACGLILSFVARFLVSPIMTLQSYARGWLLGSPWELRTPGVAAKEVRELYENMARKAGDLNAQFQKQKELTELKSQLVSMVSHEFINALTVIGNVGYLLREGGDALPSREREQYLQELRATVDSLHNEALTLLNMGSLESGKLAVRLERTALRSLIRDSVSRLDGLIRHKGHHVRVEIPDEPCYVLADPRVIPLVIMNLLSNAIKYTPDGGTISIWLRRERGPEGRARVGVQDTGIGIPAEEQKRITTPYFRTERSKSVAKGFGVGLALVRKILEAHDSRLELESTPGQGSIFSFLLPCCRERAR